MTTWDDLITDADIVAHTVDVPLCLDRSLVRAVTQAQLALTEARHADRAAANAKDVGAAVRLAAPDAEQRLVDAIAVLEAAQTILTLASIPQPEWRALKAQHPPTNEQRKEGHDAHPDKFAVAAVARSIVRVNHRGRIMDGAPPRDWVQDTLRANLTDGEWENVTSTVAMLNQAATDVGKLVGATGPRQSSVTSSTTAPHEGSLGLSSPAVGSGPTP